jgi:hypothetical protein
MVEGEADLARLPPDGEVAEGRPLYLLNWPSARAMARQ